MNKQNKTYNATDFANYHAGKMPAAEMYALERAALEDDFLADALEGYAHSNDHETEIAAIQANLKNTTASDSAKVIPIAKTKNNWFRMVAAAAIVLALSTLFYNINNKNDAQNIAKVETNNVALSDSILPQNETKINTDQAIAPQINSNVKPNTANNNAPNADIAMDVPKIIMPSMPSISTEPNTTTGFNSTTNLNVLQNQNTNGIFRIDVDSKTGGPKQLANNRNNNGLANNNIGRQDDNAKFKTLIKTDSTSFPIAMNDKVVEKEQEAPAIASKPEAKMEEVVVTSGYGNNKRKDVASATTTVDALKGKVAGVQVKSNKEVGIVKINTDVDNVKINTTALQEFNTYVRKNIKPVFDDKGNEIKGTVKLSFKTNKAGQPIKIKVVQSLSKKADAQAEELLKNATKWQANKLDRIIVDIVF
jgi:hypothetical protein